MGFFYLKLLNIMNGFIYKTTSPNGKIYIGQTIDFKVRCRKSYKGMVFKFYDEYIKNKNL